MTEREELQRIVDRLFARKEALRVLEAGCGSVNQLALGPNSRITGIDISERQLARNDGLTEKILGDIQTYPLPEASFDLIVCWDVLEHLSHPEEALSNFVRAIRPGGLIVLAFPDVNSVKARITKYTPHWFHVWAYRNLFGIRSAGLDGNGPFKTYLRSSIAPAAIERFAREHGFRVVLSRRYEAFQRLIRNPVLRSLWGMLTPAVAALSFGRLDGGVSDAIVVLEKLESDQRT